MDYIKGFIGGKWLNEAKQAVLDQSKLKKILSQLKSYMSKSGLSTVLGSIQLLYSYVSDICTGKYKNYNPKNLLLIVAVLIYIITPTDLLPDFFPGGLIDDAAIVTWAVHQLREELDNYQRKCLK